MRGHAAFRTISPLHVGTVRLHRITARLSICVTSRRARSLGFCVDPDALATSKYLCLVWTNLADFGTQVTDSRCHRIPNQREHRVPLIERFTGDIHLRDQTAATKRGNSEWTWQWTMKVTSVVGIYLPSGANGTYEQ